MAKLATTTLSVTVTGDGVNETYVPPTAPVVERERARRRTAQSVALSSGDNTLSVPPGAQGLIFVPPSASAVAKKLKGIGGDTGLLAFAYASEHASAARAAGDGAHQRGERRDRLDSLDLRRQSFADFARPPEKLAHALDVTNGYVGIETSLRVDPSAFRAGFVAEQRRVPIRIKTQPCARVIVRDILRERLRTYELVGVTHVVDAKRGAFPVSFDVYPRRARVLEVARRFDLLRNRIDSPDPQDEFADPRLSDLRSFQSSRRAARGKRVNSRLRRRRGIGGGGAYEGLR
jgi:hypothetical protein